MKLCELSYDTFQDLKGVPKILEFRHVESRQEVFFCELEIREIIHKIKHKIENHKAALKRQFQKE